MSAPQSIPLDQTRGFQHANRDGYYYRPLVFGKELFMYVAHVPAGGTMPADQEESELFELALFMIEGELEVTLGDEVRTVRRYEGQSIPRGVAFGVANTTSQTASFVLSFAPPPEGEPGLEPMFDRARERGSKIWEPAELNAIWRG